ncbi:MAG: hydrogenase iron-sulfur subunit [Pseudomonadota bacterium]
MTSDLGGQKAEFHVRIASTGDVIGVPYGVSILEALKGAGYYIPNSCTVGLCGTCRVRFLAGEVDHQDMTLDGDEQSEYLTTCVSRARSAELLLDLPPPEVTQELAQQRPIAVVNQDICVACLTCVRACTYGAAQIDSESVGVGGIMGAAVVDDDACRGCGLCAAACPTGAIGMTQFADRDVIGQVTAHLGKNANDGVPAPTPKQTGLPQIVTFCCPNSAPSIASFMEREASSESFQLKVIEMPCTGRIDNLHILQSFEQGADGVIVSGCEPGRCHHSTGNENAAKRVRRAERWLTDVGLGAQRVCMAFVPVDGAERFGETAAQLVEDVRSIGPNPLGTTAAWTPPAGESEKRNDEAGADDLGPEDLILQQLGFS